MKPWDHYTGNKYATLNKMVSFVDKGVKKTINNSKTKKKNHANKSLKKWQSLSCDWLEQRLCGAFFFAGCNLNTPLGYRTS